MGRCILFVTTDQQRYDTLGCNGGTLSRTPVVDQLAAQGHRFERCHPSSVVCMPSRSTILTGQHPSAHGVWMNGVPLAQSAPSVAEELATAGYRTALIGKAHFEPLLDPFGLFAENRLGMTGAYSEPGPWFDGTRGPHRGFDHMELATHGAAGWLHYSKWLQQHHPEAVGMFYRVLDDDLEVSAAGGGDTGAPQAHRNEIPRDWYHTDWVADRTVAWLEALDAGEDFFCWMSFPDPHHPWDPPSSEVGRVNWRDVELPAGYVADPTDREAILAAKPSHWSRWYRGELVSNYEAPAKWVPATLTADQVREVNALNAVEVELVDEAIGRVLAAVERLGFADRTDVVVTTDHGELQGDYGLLFKGPYHTDGLLRLPLVWRPAPVAAAAPSTVTRPVGLVDLAATFLSIAGLATPSYMEGRALPSSDEDAAARGFDAAITEWDSELFGVSVHLRTVVADRWLLTRCDPSTVHEGTEGELYSLADDPLQRVNRFEDPSCATIRDALLERLAAHDVRAAQGAAAPGPLVAPV